MKNDYFSEANKVKTPCHYTDKNPVTQMQLVFSKHWAFMKKYFTKAGRSLEVGCGRGNLSVYFAKNGWACHLADLSQSAIDSARGNFENSDVWGTFRVGNAERLPYLNSHFDCVFSVGLLEHFRYPRKAIQEMWRVTKNGGFIFYYIVPEKRSMQNKFSLLNRALAFFSRTKKPDIKTMFRDTRSFAEWKQTIEKHTGQPCEGYPVFPIPLISHSVAFPFVAMPQPLEYVIVLFQKLLIWWYGWICEEPIAQGYMYVQKKEKA